MHLASLSTLDASNTFESNNNTQFVARHRGPYSSSHGRPPLGEASRSLCDARARRASRATPLKKVAGAGPQIHL